MISLAVKKHIRQAATLALTLVMATALVFQAATPAYADDKQK